jgi:hypothetical protein
MYSITGLFIVGVSLLLPLGFVEARPAILAWDYPATVPPQHTGFILRGCQRADGDCVMRDVQQVGPQRRQARVQVPGQRVRCFEIVALLAGDQRSGPSNRLCLN